MLGYWLNLETYPVVLPRIARVLRIANAFIVNLDDIYLTWMICNAGYNKEQLEGSDREDRAKKKSQVLGNVWTFIPREGLVDLPWRHSKIYLYLSYHIYVTKFTNQLDLVESLVLSISRKITTCDVILLLCCDVNVQGTSRELHRFSQVTNWRFLKQCHSPSHLQSREGHSS